MRLAKLSRVGMNWPPLYFGGVALTMAFGSNLLMLLAAGLLFSSLYFRNVYFNVVASAFTMFFSFWMLLAWLSDYQGSGMFDMSGLLFVVVNFVMATLLGLPFFKMQIDQSDRYGAAGPLTVR